MNIPKPKYLCEEIKYYFEQEEGKNKFNSLEKNILDLLILSLTQSEKYIFSEDYALYLEDVAELANAYDHELEKNKFFKKHKLSNTNISIEIIDNLINSAGEESELNNIFQIINKDHPLFKKLMEMLNIKRSENEDMNLCLFYRKNKKGEWTIPVKTLLIYEDGRKQIVDIFPKLAFSLNNSINSMDQKESLEGFFNGLFDLFVNSSKILGNSKVEFIFIAPPKKNKKRKMNLYGYKVAHIFLKKPFISLRNNQGIYMLLKSKNKKFNQHIKNLNNNLFLKR